MSGVKFAVYNITKLLSDSISRGSFDSGGTVPGLLGQDVR